MKLQIASILLLVLILKPDNLVSGKCLNSYGAFDTDWAACIPQADSSGNCPHNFLKLGDNAEGCRSYNTHGRRGTPLVCCLLTPVMEMKIKDAPCLTNSGDSDETQDKKKSKSH